MKKNILFIFLFLIFPLSVYANNIELDCENILDETNEVSCEIIGSSNETITEVSFHIVLSDMLSLTSFTTTKQWEIITNNDDSIVLTSEGLTDTFEIGKLIFKIVDEEEGNITIESIKYKTINNDDIILKNINRHLPLSSNSSLLSSIIIENYLINFDPNTYSYNLKIKDENTLNISAIPENSNTTYTVLHNDNLTDGTEIQIITRSKDNMSSTYTLKITKEIVPEKKDNLYIFIGIVTLIVIINIIRIIRSRKK